MAGSLAPKLDRDSVAAVIAVVTDAGVPVEARGGLASSPGNGDDLAAGIGRTLARLHAITPAEPRLSALPLPMLPPGRAAVAMLKPALAAASQARPALEYALAWLDANAPQPPRSLVLVHGDFQPEGLALDGAGVAAIAGWEAAHWGDPHEDIGAFCARPFRFGDGKADKEAGGIGSRAAFHRGYEGVAGHTIDERAVAYWEVLAAVRGAVRAVVESDRFLVGGETAIGLALAGLTAPEMEFDALAGIAAIETARKGR